MDNSIVARWRGAARKASTGHSALEEEGRTIADYILRFFTRTNASQAL
jgi:hypothetical protein